MSWVSFGILIYYEHGSFLVLGTKAYTGSVSTILITKALKQMICLLLYNQIVLFNQSLVIILNK